MPFNANFPPSGSQVPVPPQASRVTLARRLLRWPVWPHAFPQIGFTRRSRSSKTGSCPISLCDRVFNASAFAATTLLVPPASSRPAMPLARAGIGSMALHVPPGFSKSLTKGSSGFKRARRDSRGWEAVWRSDTTRGEHEGGRCSGTCGLYRAH